MQTLKHQWANFLNFDYYRTREQNVFLVLITEFLN